MLARARHISRQPSPPVLGLSQGTCLSLFGSIQTPPLTLWATTLGYPAVDYSGSIPTPRRSSPPNHSTLNTTRPTPVQSPPLTSRFPALPGKPHPPRGLPRYSYSHLGFPQVPHIRPVTTRGMLQVGLFHILYLLLSFLYLILSHILDKITGLSSYLDTDCLQSLDPMSWTPNSACFS